MAKKINLEPLYDRVIVEPEKTEQKSKGGVVLPDSVEKEKPQQGKVIATGKGKYVGNKFVRPEVKVGNKVLYSKFGGDEIEISGQKVIILEAKDILAIVK